VRAAASAARRAPYAREFPEFWAVIDGYEYALHDVRVVTREWVHELRAAAADAFAIFRAVAPLARTLESAALEEMGFPPAVIPLLARTLNGLPTLAGRFDFIETPDGFKAIEFNAETPFFVMETHAVNGAACRERGLNDPNAHAQDALIDSFRAIAAQTPGAAIAVTASNVYREDYWTAAYYAQLWHAAAGEPVAIVPIHELTATQSGVYHGERRIDILHRCYPLEYAANDPGGRALIAAVSSNAVTLVNPPSALFAQNKLVMALIWGLHECGELFDERERAIVAKRFLPSYSHAPQRGTWVRKPVFGREGSSIRIIRDGDEVLSAPTHQYIAQPAVFQAWVDSPSVPYRLSDGTEHNGHAIATCAVTAGVPTAVGLRIGDLITDGWARFAPLGMPPAISPAPAPDS
jgi:glutathionylspermidine synthase